MSIVSTGLAIVLPQNAILNAATDLETKAYVLVKTALDADSKDDITIVMAQG